MRIVRTVVIGEQPVVTEEQIDHTPIPESRRAATWEAGVAGGIPTYPVGTTLTPSGGNDTVAIQNAVNAASAGTAVYLSAGSYTVTSRISLPSNVVVRGAGSTQTTILHNGDSYTFWFQGGGGTGSVVTTTATASLNDTTISVTNASIFSTGQYIGIEDGSNARQFCQIASISGNDITLVDAIYTSFPSGSTVQRSLMVENAGVEDLYIDGSGNQFDNYSNSAKARFNRTASCWVKNIKTEGYKGQQVQIFSSTRVEIRDNYLRLTAADVAQAAAASISVAYGVEVRQGCSNVLVENNCFDAFRHALLVQDQTFGITIAGSNVFGYNYVYRACGTNGNIAEGAETDFDLKNASAEIVLSEGNNVYFWEANGNSEDTKNTVLRDGPRNRIRTGSENNFVGVDASTAFWDENLGTGGANLYHRNYRSGGIDNEIPGAEGITPDSYYLVSKPSWFGDLDWPCYGSDLAPGNTRQNPAEHRFKQDFYPESAPTELVVTRTSATAADLTWDHATGNNFIIVRAEVGGSFERIGTTSSTTYSDTSLTSGTEYFYYVRSRNVSGGESLPSNMSGTDVLAERPAYPTMVGEDPIAEQTLLSVDFDDTPLGSYTPTNLAADWNGANTNVPWQQVDASTIVEDSNAYSGRSLQVVYPAGRWGPSNSPAESGAQWPVDFTKAGGYEELYVSYRVKFGSDAVPNWDGVIGGKLPGLSGGDNPTGSWAAPRDGGAGSGFSGRMMWRSGQVAEQYVYWQGQTVGLPFGDQWAWNDRGSQEVFPDNTWIHLEHRWVMNDIGQANGIFQGWLNGVLAEERTGLELRTTGADWALDLFYFSTFYGGGDISWAPSKDEYIFFDDIVISKHPVTH